MNPVSLYFTPSPRVNNIYSSYQLERYDDFILENIRINHKSFVLNFIKYKNYGELLSDYDLLVKYIEPRANVYEIENIVKQASEHLFKNLNNLKYINDSILNRHELLLLINQNHKFLISLVG